MVNYNSVLEILREFPAKNNKWMALDSGFCAEISDFGGGEILDPWNRQIPGSMTEVRDNIDNETTHWVGVTTVNGFPVRLTIFND
jgi:hypothetical protein